MSFIFLSSVFDLFVFFSWLSTTSLPLTSFPTNTFFPPHFLSLSCLLVSKLSICTFLSFSLHTQLIHMYPIYSHSMRIFDTGFKFNKRLSNPKPNDTKIHVCYPAVQLVYLLINDKLLHSANFLHSV